MRKTVQIVDFATLAKERDRLRPLLGPGDERLLLATLELFFKLSTSGAEVFDNCRLREEGMPAPPRFTSYLRACATLPANRSIYEQMLDEI